MVELGQQTSMLPPQEKTSSELQEEHLRTELEGMKNGALRKQAAQLGIHEDILEEADDADDVKAALIELIVQERVITITPEESLHAELIGMKNGALRKRAVQHGISEDLLEEADDATDPKAAFINLIIIHVLAAGANCLSSVIAPDLSSFPKSQQEVAVQQASAPPGLLSPSSKLDNHPYPVLPTVPGPSRQYNYRMQLRNTFIHVVDVTEEVQRETTLSRSRSDSSLSSSVSLRAKRTAEIPTGGPEHLVFNSPRNRSTSNSSSTSQPQDYNVMDRLQSFMNGRSASSASHAADPHEEMQKFNPALRESSSCSNSDLAADTKADMTNPAALSQSPSSPSIPKNPSEEPAPHFTRRIPVWSAGASEHEAGTCRPCAWMWRLEGCSNEADCEFCHMCTEESLKNAVAARRAAQRKKAREFRRPFFGGSCYKTPCP